MKRLVALIAAAWCAASVAASAADVGATYPAGSITTREQAEQALEAVRAASKEAETAHRTQLQHCATVFLQNKCTSEARHKLDADKRELRRVEIEARDVRRKIDADERMKQRLEAESKRQSERAAGSPPDPKDHAATQAEKDTAAAANREQYQQRQKAHAEEQAQRKAKEDNESAERAASVKAYEEKQRAAAEYAKRKEEERIQNEKRREDRRIEREKAQKEREDQAKR